MRILNPDRSDDDEPTARLHARTCTHRKEQRTPENLFGKAFSGRSDRIVRVPDQRRTFRVFSLPGTSGRSGGPRSGTKKNSVGRSDSQSPSGTR